MTKIEKLIKIGNIEEENSLYLLNELSNFNEIFSEDVTYDNIKSPKKQEFMISLNKITILPRFFVKNLKWFLLLLP